MDISVISNLFDSSKNSESITESSSSVSTDDITSLLMRSFNEAEEDDDGIDWGVSDQSDQDDKQEESDVNNDDSEEDETSEESEDVIDDNEETNDEQTDENDDLDEYEDDTSSDEEKLDGEILGSYESMKDELESERETLSEIYERFFKEVVDPLFRRLEDSNINVAFDTTKLKSEGVIRIELSHRNSDASAEMEINIFANTVNGEFLGMENSDGEAVSTSLDDVSLDDLLTILIKVLA